MIKKIIYVLLFISNYSMANFEILQKGISVTDNNINELATTSWEYAKSSTTQKKFNDGFASAFFMKEGTIDLYSLSDKPALYLTNFETREVLGNWPLTTPYSCDDGGDDCELNWWVGRWSDQEFLEPLLKERIQRNSGGNIQVMPDGLGCFNKTPLRYGDIDGDSKNELVLFLNDNLLIFSPEKQKTIFLSLYNLLGDHTSLEDTIEQYTVSDPTNPQHVSSLASNSGSAFENPAAIVDPAYKVYAKHYVQDFDNDQNNELVVWRKFYESRLQGDTVKGYKKISDTYLHYKKVNGEYQLQTNTTPETIQGWLSTKNLTWQKGFPTKSECAGQEGQLIPEMHDPLLNDPDVLK
ncbi:hypothetical protein QNI23_004305 [Bermanella sp. WJH001]|uniref:hypothetical protein n=1 Tax=Bermanella sp. WJH001 TaxID=3048005 RepID=UPI0024BDE76E|nr:hypothetical protein [Bermanella sp. WJH001]MDJ1539706.1 hypothetical protein [Bermanella sp. WJH001]